MTKYKVILEFELERNLENGVWSAHKVAEYLHYNQLGYSKRTRLFQGISEKTRVDAVMEFLKDIVTQFSLYDNDNANKLRLFWATFKVEKVNDE